MDFQQLLETQAHLQTYQKDGPPLEFDDDEQRVEFIRWNVLALEDELHEMLQEVGWKPWATNRQINTEAALKELVDALHFFLNLIMAIGSNDREQFPTLEELAIFLISSYQAKVEVNIERQLNNYDGISGKCSYCHRDLAESKASHPRSNRGNVICLYQESESE